ncbi:DUF1800 domain-containing protein [Paraglaciecola arctica]|uniref:DUF1800 domain-containing protein n=1 Tax=Paraglaciecola arctica TaxID=1128911 RepID=UPI001C06BFFE|nr:DUF1800 domain-containing protein [Paraglaciecola arctica]MBU3005549.1 DUF1800 domain-containing protein [Paraglaciecola arctica]
MYRNTVVIVFLLLAVSSCGGGADNSASAPPAVVIETPTPTVDLDARMKDAARLLNQASFGPSETSIEKVVELGREQWIDWQMELPLSSQVDYLIELQSTFSVEDELSRMHRIEAWWQNTLRGEDQLRQRVAFALSEIFVISENSNFFEEYVGIANYYDVLAKHAFGNYRALLEEVTLSPMMGMYLSMLGNEKPNSERNIRPDENYAREVMQLFSIGLVELNLDGTVKLDETGSHIPTYDQSTIEGFAHVFTGWNFNGTTEQTWWHWWDNYDALNPMQAVQARHDIGTKTLLNDVILPANQSAELDLTQALDNIFMHDNVAPFISKQLIQRLVTSNPSAEYVARVSAIFNNNGAGERGDLGAVVKGILMDDEAIHGHVNYPNVFGKLREPILKATHLWRAFKAYSPSDRFQQGYPDYFFKQAPLAAPSVFNFFSPGFSPPGVIAEQGLVAPEFQITTENYAIRTSNFFAYSALWSHTPNGDAEQVIVDFSEEIALVNETDDLLERLNILLMAGGMTDEMRKILSDMHDETVNAQPAERVADLVFLIMNSPQYSVQK